MKNMTLGWVAAFFLSLSAGHDALAQQPAGAPTVSKAAAKPLKAGQEAIPAKNDPEALKSLEEVRALPGKSAYDTYLMNEMLGFAHASLKDYAAAAPELEAGLDSGFLEGGAVPQRIQ